MKVAVLSTFDIYPTNDGGRRRYTSIMRPMSRYHDVTLLAYHLGEGYGIKRYALAERFKVVAATAAPVDIRNCWDHFKRSQRIAHDVLCIREHALTEEFSRLAAEIIGNADVVIVAHPYLVMLARTYAKRGAIQVYESYNVEFDAKLSHFDKIEPQLKAKYLSDVVYAEGLACRTSHYVTAVSETDADRLAELYDVTRDRIQVLPNGVDVDAYPVFSTEAKREFRRWLGIDDASDCAVFVGSAYGPNVSGYRAARALLAEAGFEGTVILVGSIAQAGHATWAQVPFKEIWLGFVEDDVRIAAVGCADFALQFVYEGAGTNLKLFDYMASRTLIVANDFGARGVDEDGWHVRVADVADMKRFLRDRPWTTEDGKATAAKARAIAERSFDWAAIASRYASMISGRKNL